MRSIYPFLFIIFMFTVQLVQGQARTNTPLPAGTEPINIKVYPSPASTQVTFNFENGYNRNYSFQIFNFIGKKIVELRSVDPKTVVDVSYFFRGVYIFQVRDKTGKIVESGRFTVER